MLFDRGDAKQTQEMFDAHEAEYKRKIESGEINMDEEGEAEAEEEAMSEDNLKEWQKQQDEKSIARGGGGMKKVQQMLDSMGMQMVTEEEVIAQQKAKAQKKQEKQAQQAQQGVKDDL